MIEPAPRRRVTTLSGVVKRERASFVPLPAPAWHANLQQARTIASALPPAGLVRLGVRLGDRWLFRDGRSKRRGARSKSIVVNPAAQRGVRGTMTSTMSVPDADFSLFQYTPVYRSVLCLGT